MNALFYALWIINDRVVRRLKPGQDQGEPDASNLDAGSINDPVVLTICNDLLGTVRDHCGQDLRGAGEMILKFLIQKLCEFSVFGCLRRVNIFSATRF